VASKYIRKVAVAHGVYPLNITADSALRSSSVSPLNTTHVCGIVAAIQAQVIAGGTRQAIKVCLMGSFQCLDAISNKTQARADV
jgi:hypothetical protein